MSPKPFALSVKALIRDRHGRLLLLRRSPESGLDPGAWDLPGGKVEPGEDFAGALLREARERRPRTWPAWSCAPARGRW